MVAADTAQAGQLGDEPLSAIGTRDFAEAINIPFFLHRGDTLLYANGAFAELTGHSQAKLQRMAFYEIAHPDWQAMLRDYGRRRLRGEGRLPPAYELRLNTGHGREVWVEIRPRIIPIDGQPTSLVGCLDITEHRRVLAQRQRLLEMHQQAELTLQEILDGDPVPTFVIDAHHVITHWNKACETVTGHRAEDMVGSDRQWQAFYADARPVLADILVDGGDGDLVDTHYRGKYRRSACIPGAYEAEDFFPRLGRKGRWLHFTAAPLHDEAGHVIGAIETLQDITERRHAEEALRESQSELESLVQQRTAQLSKAMAELEYDISRREEAERELRARYREMTELNGKLTDTNQKLEEAHHQLLQSEKMASIGQLAAGVAHEINNPIGYLHSNMGSLEGYLEDLFALIAAHEGATAGTADPEAPHRLRREIDFDYLKDDVPALMREFREGITRVRKIVQDLKDFSRVDQSQEWQWADIHLGLDSTLNIATNEIKYKADVRKEYGDLPEIQCLPSQLNQVFMNLLVNAAQAIDSQRGLITIRTGRHGEGIWVEIADNGCGIPEHIRTRIFDPFFTTKPVGKGTGLGLSLSYGIIKKHHGDIEVLSSPGQGTTFRVTLPTTQEAPLSP